MKVLHLESGRHLYGGAVQVAELIGGLHSAGVSSLLVCPSGSSLAGTVTDAEVVTLRMSGDLDIRLPRRLARQLRAWRPDLIHVHSRRGADLYGGIAARRERLPAVLTRRVESHEPASWQRFKYRPYQALIAISARIAEALTQAGIEPARVHTVPSGVDTTKFRPQRDAGARLRREFGLPAAAPVVAMIAQLIPRKGHAALLDALSVVVGPQPDLHVVLFGQGPEEPLLRREVQRRGLEGRVRFAGFRADMPQLLPGIDVVVHPAFREGMGVALLEAMSAGVAVIASSEGGISEVIEDGVHGRLIRPGESATLADALIGLLADAPARRAMGVAARRHVQQRFSSTRMVEGNLDVYRGLLASTGSPSERRAGQP